MLKSEKEKTETVQRQDTFFTNKEGEGKRKVNKNNSHKVDQGHQQIYAEVLRL